MQSDRNIVWGDVVLDSDKLKSMDEYQVYEKQIYSVFDKKGLSFFFIDWKKINTLQQETHKI